MSSTNLQCFCDPSCLIQRVSWVVHLTVWRQLMTESWWSCSCCQAAKRVPVVFARTCTTIFDCACLVSTLTVLFDCIYTHHGICLLVSLYLHAPLYFECGLTVSTRTTHRMQTENIRWKSLWSNDVTVACKVDSIRPRVDDDDGSRDDVIVVVQQCCFDEDVDGRWKWRWQSAECDAVRDRPSC